MGNEEKKYDCPIKYMSATEDKICGDCGKPVKEHFTYIENGYKISFDEQPNRRNRKLIYLTIQGLVIIINPPTTKKKKRMLAKVAYQNIMEMWTD